MSDKVRIKVCGMTAAPDVEVAIALGVDAIGMILHADSPRCIDLDRAALIRSIVPDNVSLIGVFVDAGFADIEAAIVRAGLDAVQLHGRESDVFGAALSVPFIKAIRVENETQLRSRLDCYPSACAILLDPYVKGQHGGTGRPLDLRLWPHQHHQKLILAGGLSFDNISSSIHATQPFAVDLNSGVELSPGMKDHRKMKAVVELIAQDSTLDNSH